MSTKLWKSVFAFVCIAVMAACSSGTTNGTRENKTGATGDAGEPGKPVETRSPNTRLRPAFEGQTRAPRVTTITAFDYAIVTNGLDRPWDIELMPDGRIMQAGTADE